MTESTRPPANQSPATIPRFGASRIAEQYLALRKAGASMTCERSVIAAIVFLGLGLGLILGYCHDSTVSFSAAHPASAATLQFVIYTNGWPAMAGVAATVVGILLLFAALAFAVPPQIAPRGSERRENASVAGRR